MPAPLRRRSLSIAGHRTSVALEPQFWEVIAAMANARGMPLADLVAGIDAARDPAQGLASALRVAALCYALEREA